ncbi:hypothetical protein K503DRAFT_768110 [Rhizopogon vinicolor AM-OR11-026]|uniref:Uncharacterized protein n=1 Tax=Rhizopogon vinicolor AM-OR11-026 TaxID=1314800 RepID=A0A1B7N7W5_9AGAM|nr:hypothetical protein K503DRAFT_768110 [Rhizopogon vinicolor AM-OR11-026]
MNRSPVQITALLLCLSSSAYAQVFAPSNNWGGRITGIVLGAVFLLVLLSLCFVGRRRQWGRSAIAATPTYFRRHAKTSDSTLPYWQGTQPQPYGPPPAQPYNDYGASVGMGPYRYNGQSAAPPPYAKEGATTPQGGNYAPPPGPPPPAHMRA